MLVLNTNTQREHGRKAQLVNIVAAKSVSSIIRTTLGPRSMLKMILDPMGGIVMTNDGNAILREVDVSHPAAKSMIELSRAQDEEVGDGTTSVIIISGELLSVAEPFLRRNMHPRIIVGAYMKALEVSLEFITSKCMTLDLNDRDQMLSIVRSTLGTKFVSRFGDLVCNLALDSVKKIAIIRDGRDPEIDIKRYARVEKIPGGYLEQSEVLNGLCLNKDVVHPRMKRMIKNPRILLLDTPLEYKKMESQANIEVSNEEDWDKILKMEEEYVEGLCKGIIAAKPNLVFTEKGVSDLAQHYLMKAGITVVRRCRKTDNNRIARAVGATIVSRCDEISESNIGTGCGLFEVRKVGDDYFSFLVECKDPKACTILLRGASKDVLSEIERNLADAMHVVRNIITDPRVVPGGGAVEMAVANNLLNVAKSMDGVMQWPFRAVAKAMEVIPRTLIENSGGSTIRVLTDLRAKHASFTGKGMCTTGIDGNKGVTIDMNELKVYEPFMVKSQTLKTAIEAAGMLLRIDDIVSGMSKKNGGGGGTPGPAPGLDDLQDDGTFGDYRDG